MIKLINASLLFLCAGIFTSVTILAAYQILFIIPCFYFTYLYFKEKNFKLPKSSWFLSGLIIWSVIGLILNLETIPKPLTNFGKVKYFYYGFAGILVFNHWLKSVSEKTIKSLIHLFFLSIILAGIYSYYQVFIVGRPRALGFTGIMRYGYGSAMILLTLLSAILHHNKIKNWFNLKYAYLTFFVGVSAMFITYTRGALLGFLCGLPFVLFYYKKKWGLIFSGLSLILVGFLGIIYLTGNQIDPGNSRYLMNKNNSSDQIRRSQWQSAIIAFKEKPIYGWGLSNFSSQVKRIKEEHDLHAKDYSSHSHNLFLEFAAGTGLIGLLLFSGWVFFWAIEIFQAGGVIRALIIPFGVAFVISSQFEVTFDANNASTIFTIYALSISASVMTKKQIA